MFGDKLFLPGVSKKVVFDDRRRVRFAPIDIKPKVEKFDGIKRSKTLPTAITRNKANNIFVDSGMRISTQLGQSQREIPMMSSTYLPKATHFFRAPARFYFWQK